jgi:hypothetical protein
MCKVQPLGAILPLAVGLSISDLPTATWKSVELSPEMTGKIQIRNNEIVGLTASPRGSEVSSYLQNTG